MKTELDSLIQIMSSIYEKNLSCYDEHFLANSLKNRLIYTGISSIDEYFNHLSNTPQEAESLFRSLHITYSEFFRNTLTFALLEEVIIPDIVKRIEESDRGGIRIWSAGCAAGQESYSISILLEEMLISSKKNSLTYRIFATDISDKELALASAGVYDESTMQNIRLKHIITYFQKQERTYSIVQRLKDRLDFSCYDLLDNNSSSPPASIYGDFDIVICSNLIFYYRQEIREFIIDKLIGSLTCGGYLVTGEVEREMVEKTTGLYPVFRSTAVYRKGR